MPVIKNARVLRDERGRTIGVVEKTLTDLSELADARRKAADAARRLGEMYTFGNLIGKTTASCSSATAVTTVWPGEKARPASKPARRACRSSGHGMKSSLGPARSQRKSKDT